eukprot:TRINITY_DN1699_c2_g4_i1.p1 TRINITY_DN1699_c2_g4~~TRINITY_DN1699_c2_g4_i1.p1  ORF type:complete len:560 (+),score=113.42 TRINITY_DN1699_c2_g4_i1:66-1682(+)
MLATNFYTTRYGLVGYHGERGRGPGGVDYKATATAEDRWAEWQKLAANRYSTPPPRVAAEAVDSPRDSSPGSVLEHTPGPVQTPPTRQAWGSPQRGKSYTSEATPLPYEKNLALRTPSPGARLSYGYDDGNTIETRTSVTAASTTPKTFYSAKHEESTEPTNTQSAKALSNNEAWDRWWAEVSVRRKELAQRVAASKQQQQQHQQDQQQQPQHQYLEELKLRYQGHQTTTRPLQQDPLPEGWREVLDNTSGRVFYHNGRTGVSVWERPTASVVTPLTPRTPHQTARSSTSGVHVMPRRSTSAGARPRARRSPSMDWTSSQGLIPPQAKEDMHKYVVVLDLDETLVYARDGPLVTRPGCKELLSFLSEYCETIIWTAGERCYAQLVLASLDPTESTVKHCVYRHPKWFTGQAGQTKDLRLLGRNLDKTILIDNTPDCIRKNVTNAALVPDYMGAPVDSTLLSIQILLKLLVASAKTVPAFLQSTPLVELSTVKTDVSDSIVVYSVGDVSSRSPNLDSCQDTENQNAASTTRTNNRMVLS